MRHRARLPSLLALLLAAGPSPSLAQWQFCGAPCGSAGSDPRIVSDGAGGALITWRDARNGDPAQSDIYAQHLLASGRVDPRWPANGRALCTAAGVQDLPTIASDGAGGAIVTWRDARSGDPAEADIYAQHVRASGVVDPSWTANGTLLCNATSQQLLPMIVSDGTGGAIVVWSDVRNGDPAKPDIFAQRVLATGVVDPAWPVNGRAVCDANGDQSRFDVVADGAGGAIVAWTDQRGSSADIYAQRLSASGTVAPGWPVNGRALCTAGGTESYSTLTSDGAGGAIVTWEEVGSAGQGLGIYAQRVLSSGLVDPAWPVDGRALRVGPAEKPAIVTDGAGGAVVTWLNYTNGANSDVFAQRVLVSGAVDPSWPADGSAVCTAQDDQVAVALVSDGAGGAIATWIDLFGDDLFAQHLLATGAVDPAWPADAVMLCNLDFVAEPRIAADGTGGAIVTWTDQRHQICAQRAFASGGGLAVTPGSARFAVHAPHPNPARAGATIGFDLPTAQRVSLRIYDVLGQLVRTVAAERQCPAGSQSLTWDGLRDRGAPASPGVYFVQVTAGGVSVTRRIAVLQ